MSNYKSSLQSNNNALSANNLDLQSLIEQANALPDIVNIDEELLTQDDLIAQITNAVNNLPSAGSGGSSSIETCTVTIKESFSPITPTFYYTDAITMTIKSITTKSATLLVPKNTIIAMTDWEAFNSSAGCEQIFYYMRHAAYQILSDSTFTIRG